ncbi:MAG: TlpA disulfide reductase family protein [Bacteroidota bacterium]
MKTFFSIICLSICIPFGVWAQSEPMDIQGRFTGFEDSAYLFLYVSAGGVGTKTDSAMIVNGQFHISHHLPETPNVIYLAGENFDPFLKIWAENLPISIIGNKNNFRHCKVTGAPINDVAIQFLDAGTNRKKQLKLIHQHIDTEPAIHSLFFLKDKLSLVKLEELYHQIPERLADYRFTKRIKSFLEASEVKPPKVGDQMIDFEAFDGEGKTYTLSELNDRYMILEFGSSFCGPCFKAAPELSELQETEAAQLKVISFSIDSREDNWRKSLKRLAGQEGHAHILHLWDGEGENGKIPFWYDVKGVPVFFIINPEGVVVDKWVGYKTGIVKRHWEKVISSK